MIRERTMNYIAICDDNAEFLETIGSVIEQIRNLIQIWYIIHF